MEDHSPSPSPYSIVCSTSRVDVGCSQCQVAERVHEVVAPADREHVRYHVNPHLHLIGSSTATGLMMHLET